jgi:chaperone modulatory protein CbpM
MAASRPSGRPDIIDTGAQYSFDQFCKLCRIKPDILVLLVEEGIIVAEGAERDSWTFSFAMVKRLKRAYRLQRDLELNLPGVALSVDLLEEIDQLKSEVNQLRQRLETLDKFP